MKKTNKYSTEFYKSGKYIIECIDSYDKKAKRGMMDVWISRDGIAHKMNMFGLYYEQPDALDGKTTYTRDELLEIVEGNLPEYKKFYEEELAEIEGFYNSKW